MVGIAFGEGEQGRQFEFETVADVAQMPSLRDGDSVMVRTVYPGESVDGVYVTSFLHDLSEETFAVLLLDMFMRVEGGIPTVVKPSVPDDYCGCGDGCCEDGCECGGDCNCDDLLNYYLPGDIIWHKYFDEHFNAELYITSEPLQTFGSFENVHVGIARSTEYGNEDFGQVFVLLDDEWNHVGQLLFTPQEVQPTEILMFATNERRIPGMTVVAGLGGWGNMIAIPSNVTPPDRDVFGDLRFSFRSLFPTDKIVELQRNAREIKELDRRALTQFYWAIGGTTPDGIVGDYGIMVPRLFSDVLHAPLRGVSIVEYVLANNITHRGRTTFNATDERRWNVGIQQEFENYLEAQQLFNLPPISFDEFLGITLQFWEADAMYRQGERIRLRANTVFTTAQVGMGLYGIKVALQGASMQLSISTPRNVKFDWGGLFRVAGTGQTQYVFPSISWQGSFAISGNISNVGVLSASQIGVLSEAVSATLSEAMGSGGGMPPRPDIPTIANRGSTGRTTPNNLNEQIAMQEVKSNPLSEATQVPIDMTDPRWPGDTEGWVKMQRVIYFSNDTHVTIHFNYSEKLRLVDDFKFVFP